MESIIVKGILYLIGGIAVLGLVKWVYAYNSYKDPDNEVSGMKLPAKIFMVLLWPITLVSLIVGFVLGVLVGLKNKLDK